MLLLELSFEAFSPIDVWKLILGLAFVLSAALLIVLNEAGAFKQIRMFLNVAAPVTFLLTLDCYFQLNKWESLYTGAAGGQVTPGSTVIEGHTLNERRFRAQRNFYLCFFTLVLEAALYSAHKLIRKYRKMQEQLVELQGKQTKRNMEDDKKIIDGHKSD